MMINIWSYVTHNYVRISIIFSWKLKHHISSTFGPRLVGLQTTYIWCCVFYALCIICGTWSCDDQHHILLKTFGPRLALAPGLQTTGGCLHTFHSVALICTRFVQIYKIYKRLFGSLDSVFQAEWPTQTVDSVFASLRGDLALWVRIKHKM